MTNGSVSAHLDGLPHFKSFSETEQFEQASPLSHYRRVKAMQEKYGLEILQYSDNTLTILECFRSPLNGIEHSKLYVVGIGIGSLNVAVI